MIANETASSETGRNVMPAPDQHEAGQASIGGASRASAAEQRLFAAITELLAPLGYEVVHLEVHTHRQKLLRLFIDRPADREDLAAIGVEDCATASRSLDEPLDQLPEMESIFKGSYELEVSSPGIDRPLRFARDFSRFSGKEARIHVFRPLTSEEVENDAYQAKNPRQKNFFGTLQGCEGGKVALGVTGPGEKSKTKKKAAKPKAFEIVRIPLSLISKAHLEPSLESLLEERKSS